MSDALLTRKRILLVDDDPNICRFISESLRLRGFDVDCFASAELAQENLGETEYDLALLDILLPGDNGLQLCRKIHTLPGKGTLPVIMMTAFYRQDEHIRQAREKYGVTDYLLKPFPLQTLHAKIEQVLGAAGQQDDTDRIDIGGNLEETSLPRILHNLYSLRATGLLHLERGDLKKVIYVKNGYPIFVRSNLVREFLGQRLVNEGIISNDQLETSLNLARESGQKHGTALVSMGLLTPHQLNEALHQQVVDKLLEIFSWPRGTYRFVQAREFKQGVTSIVLSPANLILQGLKNHAGQDQIMAILDPLMGRYPQLAENPLYRFQEIELSPSENRLIEQCDGRQTLSRILNRHQLSRKEVNPLLAALLVTGILVAEENPLSEEEVVDDVALQDQRETFLKEYDWMMRQDYFSLLGLNEKDSRDNIHKAYHGLVRKYHPDRFFEQELFPDLKEQINTLFQKINDAHDTLVDPVRRAQYIIKLKGAAQKDVKADKAPHTDAPSHAEIAFQKGMSLFRRKDYAAALNQFNLAARRAPERPEYLTYQAWTSVKATPDNPALANLAKRTLLKSAELNPRIAVTHLFLGYLLKEEGKQKEALRRFERAIKYDPKCSDALRELRLYEMRQKDRS